MPKYGFTLRTANNKNPAKSDVHNVVMRKGMDHDEAVRLFTGMVTDFGKMMGRLPTSYHSFGGKLRAAEWLVQNGQPGQDLAIFIDEYEDD